jgi:hypothetical protein
MAREILDSISACVALQKVPQSSQRKSWIVEIIPSRSTGNLKSHFCIAGERLTGMYGGPVGIPPLAGVYMHEHEHGLRLRLMKHCAFARAISDFLSFQMTFLWRTEASLIPAHRWRLPNT